MEKLILLIPLGLGGLLIAFGVFFIRLGMKQRGFDRRIASEGRDAEAVIVQHRQVHVDLRNGGGRDSFYLTFEYTVNAPGNQPNKLTQEIGISSDDYQRFNPGDKLAIRYLPNEPQSAIPLSEVHEQIVPFFMKGGIAGFIVGALMILIGVVAWLRWPSG